jgi:hypothetical protein
LKKPLSGNVLVEHRPDCPQRGWTGEGS